VANLNSNLARAGVTSLKTFVGNSCVAAMNSFQMNSDTAACLGVQTNSDIKSPLSAVPSQSPTPARAANWEIYYPVVTSLHNPAVCKTPMGDCSGFSNPCDAADTYSTCTVTKLDHYTTSFNFAQTNFSAVWLRKGWDLVTNSAITDTQTGGLNFITGGGYTRADVGLGEWLVARNTVFVGHTQPPPEDDASANPFAMDVGPFNKYSKLACDDSSPDHCAYSNGGISFNLNPYPGQKLFNIYDGPSHQTYNAFLDINIAKMTCAPSSGNCSTDPYRMAAMSVC